MSIPQGSNKINLIVLVAICVVLGLMLLFGGLKLQASAHNKTPIRVDSTAVIPDPVSPQKDIGNIPATEAGRVVASKNSKKYHLLDCPGAKTIIEKNKVFYESPAAAQKAGLTPAANCKGLQKP